eukprot:905153-Pelagomonas_calceolata.AAC.1
MLSKECSTSRNSNKRSARFSSRRVNEKPLADPKIRGVEARNECVGIITDGIHRQMKTSRVSEVCTKENTQRIGLKAQTGQEGYSPCPEVMEAVQRLIAPFCFKSAALVGSYSYVKKK